jgi:hypothetical protein
VPIRQCQVSFEDLRGVRHSVTLQASSVLEAAGLGLKRVRAQEILDDDAGFSDITVEVATKTVHVVPIAKLREWRDTNGKTPRRWHARRALVDGESVTSGALDSIFALASAAVCYPHISILSTLSEQKRAVVEAPGCDDCTISTGKIGEGGVW